MKALIYKDLCMLGQQMRFFLLLVVLMALVPGASTYPFAIVYAGMLPFSALAYDERGRWNELARMMPYTPRQLVMGKYLLGWIAIPACGVLSAAGILVGARLQKAELAELELLPALVGVSLLLMALALPLMFRFGVEKGRMLLLGTVALTGLAATVLGESLLPTAVGGPMPDLTRVVLVGLPLLGILAQPISIFCSGKLLAKQYE